jgi:CheY-like chemotaxis protein
MNRVIVVIDDSQCMLDLMKIMIEDEGDTAILFRHPLEAIKLLPLFLPDLIISDYIMFDMDGIDVINTLRNMKIKSPMILYSGLFDDDVPKRCEALNIPFYIKGFKSEKFREILETHIGK